jgi:hypothetical protein
MKNQRRYNYNHPVFYSRKHPAYASLDNEVRLALVAALDPSEAPF